MTIQSTDREAGPFIGNDVTTVLPFEFKVFKAEDVLVIRLDESMNMESTLVLNTDYTVTLNADQNTSPGGTVTLAAPLPSGFTDTVTSELPYLQPVDVTNQGGFYPKVINDALDRLTIFVQQLVSKISRAIQLPLSVTGVSTTLPVPERNKLIGWNETASGLQNVDSNTLATIVAFGTATADLFSGNNTQTQFGLSQDPGALNNLDVAIGGVTQRPGIDYTWTSGLVITFTTPPPVGTNNILVRYLRALPQGQTEANLVAADDGASGTLWSNVQGFINRIISSAGASVVGFIQAGVGALHRSVQSKLREVVSVKDFGAVGDGVADDYPAWVLAYDSLPDTGGTIYFPSTSANKWYFSQGIVLNKPVRIIGQLPSSSLFVVNTGTVLEFAADVTGITINSFNSLGANPGGSPAGNWCEVSHLAVVSRGGKLGNQNGGTGAACDGVLIRGPGARLNNVWAFNFKRNGVRISAAIGSGGATEGNANLWYLNDVQGLQNGSDGLYVDGADANAGLALKCNFSNNDGYGIVDSSFLGNTYIGCHTDGNLLGPIVTDDPNAQSVFLGCYAETGEASLVEPTIMIGGLNSSNSRVSNTSTAFVLGGGGAIRKPFTYINAKGPTPIGATTGRNDNSMSAFTFGAATESASLDAWKFKFDNVNNAWKLQFANSIQFEPIRYLNSASSLFTEKGLTGPVFQNGYGVRNFGDADGKAKARLLGSSAPSSGTFEVGDIVYNNAPTAGGFIGFVCVSSGSPGTWKTFGAISP